MSLDAPLGVGDPDDHFEVASIAQLRKSPLVLP
jgi:hypothetical protein